ncbi:MAG: DMT family transporter [Nanoarchaeota archaeon]
MYLPIIGSFLEATGMNLEKYALRKKNLHYGAYTTYEFLAIVIVSLFFVYFTWGVYDGARDAENIIRFVFVVFFAMLANLCIFYSLKRETISEFEPIWLMQPLFTVLLAFSFYADERNWIIVGLAVVASLTLVIAHIKKNHFTWNKYMLAVLLGSLFFAIELNLSKPLLQYYSPFTFYFIRCLSIFVIVALIYRPKFKDLDGKTSWIILLIGLIWVVYRAILYKSYEVIGVVYSTLLFSLSAVLIFLFAVIFLKEKPSARQVISAIIIVICVITAILLGN